MARFTGPVRFYYTGDTAAALELRSTARELLGVVGTPSRRARDANGMRRIRLPGGPVITVFKSGSTYNAHIYVPPQEGGELRSPGAFVIYPYNGWLYPAHLDRRPTQSTNLQAQTQPSYYQERVDALPTKPYWLDTKHSYNPNIPTEYLIEKIAKADAATTYDPIYVQNVEDSDTWPHQQDDHYNHYGHWRGGALDEEGIWQDNDWFLHWSGLLAGHIPQFGTDDYLEHIWGKFIYVNGVKFPAPGYVYGGAVYHDDTTGTNWLLIATWVSAQDEESACLYNAKANVYATRLRVDASDCPIATDNGDTITVTDFNTAVANKEDVSSLYYNWWPLDDSTTGFTLPRTASSRPSYSATCGSGWEGEKYLNAASGFCFNQTGNKMAYVAEIEGASAQEFNELTFTIGLTSVGGYLIPSTFTDALTGFEYLSLTISDNANRFDGNFHNYQTSKVYTGIAYKENVLQKLQATLEAKFVTFADRTDDWREAYINRKWYKNDVLIASQSYEKIFTGLNYADRVFSSLRDWGDYFIYYDLVHNDYVKEEYDSNWTGVNYDMLTTYTRTVVVDGHVLSTDSGSIQKGGEGYVDPLRPFDDFHYYPWKPFCGINHLTSGYSGGPEDTTNKHFYSAINGYYDDRVQLGYHVLGGGGPGHLVVHRGHEREHVMGTFVPRSVNAGPNGIYAADPPDPYLYTYNETDKRYRVAQHMFVLGINNANKLYSRFGVSGGDNTVPLIDTSFYRKRKRWSKH